MMKLKLGGATSACMAMVLVFSGAHVQADPLACQPNEEFPMLCVCLHLYLLPPPAPPEARRSLSFSPRVVFV